MRQERVPPARALALVSVLTHLGYLIAIGTGAAREPLAWQDGTPEWLPPPLALVWACPTLGCFASLASLQLLRRQQRRNNTLSLRIPAVTQLAIALVILVLVFNAMFEPWWFIAWSELWRPRTSAFAALTLWIILVISALPSMVLLIPHPGTARRGHCRTCGYDLTGNVSGQCPECGSPI